MIFFHTPKVAVIDSFKYKEEDIDGDDIPDLSHGDTNVAILKSKCPGLKVDRFDVSDPDKKNEMLEDKIAEAVQKVSGKKYAGVNMSLYANQTYEAINKDTGLNLTPEDIVNFKEKLFDRLKENYYLNRVTIKVKEGIDRLASKGVPVFICAGNEGDEKYNLFGLSKGATLVGARKIDGSIWSGSAKNSDVGLYEKGFFQIKRVVKKGKVVGYDIDGNGTVDVKAKDTSSKGAGEGALLYGTSFATPGALGRRLNGEI